MTHQAWRLRRPRWSATESTKISQQWRWPGSSPGVWLAACPLRQASLKQKPLERVSGPSGLQSGTRVVKRKNQRSGLGDYLVEKGAEVLGGQHSVGEEMLQTKAGRLPRARDRRWTRRDSPAHRLRCGDVWAVPCSEDTAQSLPGCWGHRATQPALHRGCQGRVTSRSRARGREGR